MEANVFKKLLLIAVIVSLALFVSACSPESEPVSVKPAQPGNWNVETLDEASQIAGYKLAFPALVPEGFERAENIFISQLGIPGVTDNPDPPRNAEITWTWEEDESVKFSLTQSSRKFSVGNAEPAEVCGVDGQRHYMEADEEHDMPARLVFGWSDGEMYYSLFGMLKGPLDEETLMNIACSVAVE